MSSNFGRFLMGTGLETHPKPEPIFCKYCGQKLRPNEFISGYDEHTGDPIRPFINQKICPNWRCKSKDITRHGY